MRGYRLTTLGKVVVFSLFSLIVLSTAYTVKAFILHQADNNSNLKTAADKAMPGAQKKQTDVLAKININQANYTNSSPEVDFNKLKNTKLTIYFEPDNATIEDQYYGTLDMFADVADILKNYIIEIEGNCATVYKDINDNKDNVISYNLSMSRAKAALNYLQKKGIDPNKIVIIGNGSNKPVKSNATEAGRQYNRRVEISFKLKKE